MVRNNYFVRLVRRTPRFGRVLVVLVATAGLFVAVWSGSASAGGPGQTLLLEFDEEVAGVDPAAHRVKVCGPDHENIPVCSQWMTVRSYGLVDVLPGWLWQGLVTVCVDDESVQLEIPDYQRFDNTAARHLSGVLRDSEVRAEECQPATNGQLIEVDLKEPDGSTVFGGAIAGVRVCGTDQNGVRGKCTALQHVRGPVYTAPNNWYVGAVQVRVTPSNGGKPVAREFCVQKESEDRWAKLKWWAPLACAGTAAPR